MKITIITAFPQSFSFLENSIPKRAGEKGLVDIKIINLLDYGKGKWSKIDDKPFGGGAGMLLSIEPIYRALKDILPERFENFPRTISEEYKYSLPVLDSEQDSIVLLTSARGARWNQSYAESYSKNINHLVLICGHYEGVDHRITNFIDGEVRIGDFILSGGELASMVVVDSIVRLIGGVVGDSESIEIETSFTKEEMKAEYPQYTRPENFITDEGAELSVPSVLLSGNHAEIEKWREDNTLVQKL